MLIELQEKSRHLAVDATANPNLLLQFIEELSRVGERIIDEAKKERDDLKQQVSNIYFSVG